MPQQPSDAAGWEPVATDTAGWEPVGERPRAGHPLPGSPKGVAYTWRNPKEYLGQQATELSDIAQQTQGRASTPDIWKEGKYAGSRPLLEQAGNAILSGTAETGSVIAKLGAGLMDWKTAAGLLVSKLSPTAGAAFFAHQGAKGAYDAIQNGQATPDNVQNFLLGLSTVAAAGAGAGEGAPKDAAGLSKVGQLRKAASERVQPFARKVTGVEQAVKEDVTKTAEKNSQVLAENKAKRGDVMKDNLTRQREANTEIDREKISIAEKNRQIETGNKAQQEAVAKRGELEKTVDQHSLKLGEHISKVEESVAKEANQKFDKVREKVGNPETPADGLVASVHDIEENVLQGIPENIKEFRAILKMEGPPEELAGAIKEHYGWDPEGNEPLTWNKLQSLKSRMDARLRKSRGMNGDLKRGLYQAREAVVDEMGKMAEANGAGTEWQEAREFWKNYKQDFHEPTGPSGSGSPVAQALDAVDPKNIRQPFLNKQATTGNRGVQILRKYPQHGGEAAAAHAETLLDTHKQMMGLPDKPRTEALKSSPEVHEMPARKPVPKVPESPTVDATKVAKEAIAQRAKNWGSFNARDIGILTSGTLGELMGSMFGHTTLDRVIGAGIGVGAYEGGKYAASRALNKPAVVEWLAKMPPEEAAVLSKIPGADKVKVITGLTDAAIEQAKMGKPVRLSPEARRILGQQNVARILAASTGNASQIVKTPGEARDRMRQYAPQ